MTSSGALHATNVAPMAPMCTLGSSIGFMGGLPIGVDIYSNLGPLLCTSKKETSHPGNSIKQRRNQSCQPTSTWVGSMHERNNLYAIILLKHMQPAPHHLQLSLLVMWKPCARAARTQSRRKGMEDTRETHKDATTLHHTCHAKSGPPPTAL